MIPHWGMNDVFMTEIHFPFLGYMQLDYVCLAIESLRTASFFRCSMFWRPAIDLPMLRSLYYASYPSRIYSTLLGTLGIRLSRTWLAPYTIR